MRWFISQLQYNANQHELESTEGQSVQCNIICNIIRMFMFLFLSKDYVNLLIYYWPKTNKQLNHSVLSFSYSLIFYVNKWQQVIVLSHAHFSWAQLVRSFCHLKPFILKSVMEKIVWSHNWNSIRLSCLLLLLLLYSIFLLKIQMFCWHELGSKFKINWSTQIFLTLNCFSSKTGLRPFKKCVYW